MKRVKKLFLTSIALTLTNFVMRTVVVWFNVYLTKLFAASGIGIYQLILSVYALSKTLAYAGFNLAATRLVIDHPNESKSSMRKIFAIAVTVGFSALAIEYFAAGFIADNWIMNPVAKPALQVLAFSLPFLSLSSALNGYMTAVRRMGRYSVIQLLEQISRILVTVFVVSRFGEKSIEKEIPLVCFGIAFSEFVSFTLSIICYRRDLKKESGRNAPSQHFFKRFTRLAVPDALGSYLRSALGTIEHLLIPRGLRLSGESAEKSFAEYGAVQGMALPVVLYPSAILGVVSGLLVPEIAECRREKNMVEANYIINRVLSVALVFSFAVGGVMMFFAEQLSYCIYSGDDAARFIRDLSPLVPVMFMDMTTDGMLKGLDEQFSIMLINTIDSVLCVILVYLFVPKSAVMGYILTIYIAEVINFLCSFRILSKKSKLQLKFWKNLILPLSNSLLSFGLASRLPAITNRPTPDLILSIAIGLVGYYGLMRLTGGISREDKSWFLRLFTP